MHGLELVRLVAMEVKFFELKLDQCYLDVIKNIYKVVRPYNTYLNIYFKMLSKNVDTLLCVLG